MKKLKIIRGNFWYKNSEGMEYPILSENSKAYVVDIVEDNVYYVNKEDCVVMNSNYPETLIKEILIRLVPNSEGKTVLFPEKLDKGDWIDLRSAKTCSYEKGELFFVPLGVAMKLPKSYEAYILPRSSLALKYGLILANSQGIIDGSYCGQNDEWGAWLYAIREGSIEFNDRLLQFRIMQNMPEVKLTRVTHLEDVDRKGFGEGTKDVK